MNLLDLERCEQIEFQSGQQEEKNDDEITCFLSQQLTNARTPPSRGCRSSMGTSSDVRNRSHVSMATDTYCHEGENGQTNKIDS